jgi:signal transduction histidine kinase
MEALRELPIFASLSEERRAALVAEAQQLHLEPGEILVKQGDPPEFWHVLLSGSMAWLSSVGGEEVVFNEMEAVTYMGATTVLTGEPVPVTGRATAPADLLRFRAEALFDLVRSEPAVLQEIVRQFRPNTQRAEQVLRQREKLASLGQMAAGLAHEINNPAAAARRGAGELERQLGVLRDDAPGLGALAALARRAASGAADAGDDPLAAADREEALGEWLEARGVAEAWDLAGTLAEAGLDRAWAEEVGAAAGDGDVAGALRWTVAAVAAAGLVGELEESLRRVTELVRAIKEYSYLDQDGAQDVDVRRGIEDTLTILGHKLKRAGVTVERDYDPKLAPVRASGSELNQVWTNLLDNAIDAAPGGRIRVSAEELGDRVRVEVADDGAGIPPDVQTHVFDPFFTTKPVGQGTGIGLDVAWRIVVTNHGGQLSVRSEPGNTRFEVVLPRRD